LHFDGVFDAAIHGPPPLIAGTQASLRFDGAQWIGRNGAAEGRSIKQSATNYMAVGQSTILLKFILIFSAGASIYIALSAYQMPLT
jgi:hypothetical protein